MKYDQKNVENMTINSVDIAVIANVKAIPHK